MFLLRTHTFINYKNIFFRLHEMGRSVGLKIIDLYFVRERNCKREIKLLNMLMFVKTTLWKVNFVKYILLFAVVDCI